MGSSLRILDCTRGHQYLQDRDYSSQYSRPRLKILISVRHLSFDLHDLHDLHNGDCIQEINLSEDPAAIQLTKNFHVIVISRCHLPSTATEQLDALVPTVQQLITKENARGVLVWVTVVIR